MSNITANPDPPCKGQPCTFCINPPADATLTVTFNPGGSTQHQVTKANPCVTVNVPAGAITCVVTGGGATAYSGPCKNCT